MLILNRDFKMPADGFYQIAPLGEFPHVGAGVLQVIDEEACFAMAARFAADAAVANFAGLLIDFDHFSLQGGQRSEAAGWIVALEARATKTDGVGHPPSPPPPNATEGGLYARIRWSDVGEEAVKGGRYRFLSPVWSREDCVDLGPSTGSGQGMQRVRPVRLLNAAVTNDPNLKGLRPLSNSGQGVENRHYVGDARSLNAGEPSMKAVIEKLLNHLGLAADATEAVILEKMAGMPALSAVTELQNSLTALQTKHDALALSLKTVEGELVNRHLAEFEDVVTEKTKGFWTEQLISNRAGALAALSEIARVGVSESGSAGVDAKKAAAHSTSSGQAGEEAGAPGGTRKPLHNRATARAVPPGQGGGAGPDGDSKAVKIRNRAHEIATAEKIPFGVAFRRAEKEVTA